MAARNQNIFAYLDSDDEDTPKVVAKKQDAAPSSTPVALNKPAAGNKKGGKKAAPVVVDGDNKKDQRAPRTASAGRGGRGGERFERREGGERRQFERREGGERRQFERRSGTGRGKETSKQGGGARNWGNDTDKSELKAEADAQDGAKVGDDEEVAATGDESAAPVEEVEEEEVQFTLDEYLAKKKESRSGELFADHEVRQVETDFSGAKQLTKDGKTPDFIESAYEKVYTKKTSGRKKTFVTELGFQAPKAERTPRFEDRGDSRGERFEGRGGRGGRGGREGGRGGRGGRDGAAPGGRGPQGRGNAQGRGGRGSAAVPNVTDLSAFPSLG